jgi:hypothetical protein
MWPHATVIAMSMAGCAAEQRHTSPSAVPVDDDTDRAEVRAAAPTTPATPVQAEHTMSGATSPSGQKHPGEIVHDDKIDGRTWTRNAADVPPTIAWVQVDETWVAVVRIEITGTADARRFTKFGPDGQMLETTIQAPPPQRPTPTPEPTPIPVPTPE